MGESNLTVGNRYWIVPNMRFAKPMSGVFQGVVVNQIYVPMLIFTDVLIDHPNPRRKEGDDVLAIRRWTPYAPLHKYYAIHALTDEQTEELHRAAQMKVASRHRFILITFFGLSEDVAQTVVQFLPQL